MSIYSLMQCNSFFLSAHILHPGEAIKLSSSYNVHFVNTAVSGSEFLHLCIKFESKCLSIGNLVWVSRCPFPGHHTVGIHISPPDGLGQAVKRMLKYQYTQPITYLSCIGIFRKLRNCRLIIEETYVAQVKHVIS